MLDRVNALTDLAQPHDVFWTDKSKASVVVKFQDRVEQVHAFFEKCRASAGNSACFDGEIHGCCRGSTAGVEPIDC